jgi:formylmethanofuran dehydrogenase subunit E
MEEDSLKKNSWVSWQDEELVCIAENKSCSVDSVQSLLGCTAGEGNLLFLAFRYFAWLTSSKHQTR